MTKQAGVTDGRPDPWPDWVGTRSPMFGEGKTFAEVKSRTIRIAGQVSRGEELLELEIVI